MQIKTAEFVLPQYDTETSTIEPQEIALLKTGIYQVLAILSMIIITTLLYDCIPAEEDVTPILFFAYIMTGILGAYHTFFIDGYFRNLRFANTAGTTTEEVLSRTKAAQQINADIARWYRSTGAGLGYYWLFSFLPSGAAQQSRAIVRKQGEWTLYMARAASLDFWEWFASIGFPTGAAIWLLGVSAKFACGHTQLGDLKIWGVVLMGAGKVQCFALGYGLLCLGLSFMMGRVWEFERDLRLIGDGIVETSHCCEREWGGDWGVLERWFEAILRDENEGDDLRV